MPINVGGGLLIADIPGAVRRGREDAFSQEQRGLERQDRQAALETRSRLADLVPQALSGDNNAIGQLFAADPDKGSKLLDFISAQKLAPIELQKAQLGLESSRLLNQQRQFQFQNERQNAPLKLQKARLELSDAQRDSLSKQREVLSQLLLPVINAPANQKAAIYGQQRLLAEQSGVDVSRVPQQFDENVVNGYVRSLQEVDDVLGQAAPGGIDQGTQTQQRGGDTDLGQSQLVNDVLTGAGLFANAITAADQITGSVGANKLFAGGGRLNPEQQEAQQRIRVFGQQMLPALANNPKLPVAEQERLLQLVPKTGAFVNPETEASKVKQLYGFIKDSMIPRFQAQLADSRVSAGDRSDLVQQLQQANAIIQEIERPSNVTQPQQQQPQGQQAGAPINSAYDPVVDYNYAIDQFNGDEGSLNEYLLGQKDYKALPPRLADAVGRLKQQQATGGQRNNPGGQPQQQAPQSGQVISAQEFLDNF